MGKTNKQKKLCGSALSNFTYTYWEIKAIKIICVYCVFVFLSPFIIIIIICMSVNVSVH